MTSRGTRYWSSGTIPLIAPDVLGSIISSAADISLVISDLGEILSVMVNPGHALFGRLDDWEGRDLRNLLRSESIPKLEARLGALARGEAGLRGIELNHTDATALEFPVSYSFHAIGPGGAILMLGRDLRPVAQMQQQLVDAQATLERDYEHQREIATRMRVLLETTEDAVLFVNSATGRIADLNGRAARMLGQSTEDLRNTALGAILTTPDGALDLAELAAEAVSERARAIPVALAGARKSLSLRATAFRAAGQRMLLCRLTRAEADRAEPASEFGTQLRHLYDRAPDAIAFTDSAGNIVAANDGFLTLVDQDNISTLKGRSLADLLIRGGVDLKVLIDNAVRNGQMRLYATRVVTEFGGETPVEISATFMDDPTHPALGFVLRDVSRVEGVRAASGNGAEDVRPARELVGATPLKDIVAETTEVVEKICIETAVELTGNNRVAAAEMLGLSRQSLYVKLRKYGLLARED